MHSYLEWVLLSRFDKTFDAKVKIAYQASQGGMPGLQKTAFWCTFGLQKDRVVLRWGVKKKGEVR